MNKNFLLIMFLALISFINNIICYLDEFLYLLKNINISFYLYPFLETNNIKEYFKTIKDIFCYIIFFINQNPFSYFK